MNTDKILIGLKGLAGSGKDTVANYLIENHKFTKIAFADPLKNILSIITGWPLEMIQGDSPESRKFRETVVHPDFGMTCRKMLQMIGTELFRNQFNKDIWLKIAKRTIINCPGNKVVISDVRFPNEAEMIQELGGYIFNIERPNEELLEVPSHSSEQLFSVTNEIIVKNNTTIEDLYQTIEKLIA